MTVYADSGGLIGYANVPPLIGMVVSGRLATLHELQTVYGALDCYNMAEIITVDAHNRRALSEAEK